MDDTFSALQYLELTCKDTTEVEDWLVVKKFVQRLPALSTLVLHTGFMPLSIELSTLSSLQTLGLSCRAMREIGLKWAPNIEKLIILRGEGIPVFGAKDRIIKDAVEATEFVLDDTPTRLRCVMAGNVLRWDIRHSRWGKGHEERVVAVMEKLRQVRIRMVAEDGKELTETDFMSRK